MRGGGGNFNATRGRGTDIFRNYPIYLSWKQGSKLGCTLYMGMSKMMFELLINM